MINLVETDCTLPAGPARQSASVSLVLTVVRQRALYIPPPSARLSITARGSLEEVNGIPGAPPAPRVCFGPRPPTARPDPLPSGRNLSAPPSKWALRKVSWRQRGAGSGAVGWEIVLGVVVGTDRGDGQGSDINCLPYSERTISYSPIIYR